jgi:hypothetical protein
MLVRADVTICAYFTLWRPNGSYSAQWNQKFAEGAKHENAGIHCSELALHGQSALLCSAALCGCQCDEARRYASIFMLMLGPKLQEPGGELHMRLPALKRVQDPASAYNTLPCSRGLEMVRLP